MKKAIPSLYAEYGRYIDEFRAIPFHVDLLKPVERRILYTLFKVAKKLAKSALVIGEVIGKYHPHGDQSAYGTLVNLVRRGLAIGQGNWGTSGFEDTDPAAYRYTEVSANQLVNNIAFEFIKFVPWHDPENLSHDQPKYLPCPIPIGLVGDGIIQGISFHTTKIPRYNISDLILRLIYLFKKQIDPTTPVFTIKPVFPGCDIYEHTVGEFERILTTGEGTIIVVPKYTVTKNKIQIFAKPALGFSSLKNNADDPKKPDQRKFNNIDMSQKSIIEVWVEPLEGYVDQTFVNLIHKLIVDNLNFVCNVINDDGGVILMSIDQMLLNSYEHWINSFTNKLNQEKDALIEKLFELQVIAVIRNILQDHGTLIKSAMDVINIYNSNIKYQDTRIKEFHIQETISKHNIKTLLEHYINTTTVQQKLMEIDNKLSNMSQVAYQHLLSFFPNIQ